MLMLLAYHVAMKEPFMFNQCSAANSAENVLAIQILKSFNIWQRYQPQFGVLFLRHIVQHVHEIFSA